MSARYAAWPTVHIELQVALGARKCDRVIVPKHLDCDHRERLALSRRVPASARTSTNRSAILFGIREVISSF